jgi:DNA ligase-1
MKAFSTLYRNLDASARTNQKVAALVAYFRDCPPADAAWAIHFLSGRRIKLGVRRADIKAWAAQEAAIPQWLFDESYNAVGDLAETINLVVPAGKDIYGHGLAWWVEERLMPLVGANSEQQRSLLVDTWRRLDPDGRFLWNKLLTGAFRVGVSRGLITRAVAEALSAPLARVEERLMGPWVPGPGLLAQLGDSASAADPASPRPFFLASPLQDDVTELGECHNWQAEW